MANNRTTIVDMSKVNKLLDLARDDIRASEILYKEKIIPLSFFCLEQASEKILKAYFMSYFVFPLKSVVEIAEKVGTNNKFRKLHSKLKKVNNFIQPKSYGHEITPFFDNFISDLYNAYCRGTFNMYVENTLRKATETKEQVLEKMMNKGYTRDEAERTYQLINALLPLLPLLSSDIIRKQSCNKEKFMGSLKQLRKIKHPCLKIAIQPFLEYEQKLSDYKDMLDKKIDEFMEIINVDIIPEQYKITVKDALKIFLDSAIMFMLIPLHLCLREYYNARYGDVEIPEEEIEAVPLVIEKIKHAHEIVNEIIHIGD